MNEKVVYAKQALSAASALLVAQWLMAILSIPGSKDYANQLADGTAPEMIVTIYDNFSIVLTVALAWAWLSTNRYLKQIYLEETQANPEATKYKLGWVSWGWIVPIVNFWFPKRIVDQLLAAKSVRTNTPNAFQKATGTWWATWIAFVLINDLSAINSISIDGITTGSTPPIQPSYEIAAACMLTASYLVWTKILRSLATDN